MIYARIFGTLDVVQYAFLVYRFQLDFAEFSH